MIKEIAVVIGSAYGDEGKGFTTQQFCNKFLKQGLNPVVIRHNGGGQAGHTVVNEGIRHVFAHVGSGSLLRCPTYLAEEFILNPIIFRQEYEQLATKGIDLDGLIYVNSKCRITTPFDMFLNDMKERKRDKDRHGSCGLGIFETVSREIDFTIEDCGHYLNHKLRLLEKYFDCEVSKNELENYKMNYMSDTLLTGVINNYLMDLAWMFQHIKIIKDEKTFLESYDSLVFEGAQGLLLDQNNTEGFPHLTPSNTGSKNPYTILKGLDISKAQVEFCYVTRSYLTRHGAGSLENECPKEDINKDMFDKTNIPNDYQGTLRYGKLNVNSLVERISKDQYLYYMENVKTSVMVTHLNEYSIDTKKIPFNWSVYKSYDEITQII